MKKYQTITIFVPSIIEDEVQSTMSQLRERYKLTRIDYYGIRKMNYSIKQPSTNISYISGYYVSANVEGEEKELEELKKEMKKNTNVVQFYLIRTGG